MFIQFIVNGFITGLLYAVIAVAFGITYNATKIFHIAFAAILVSSSYLVLFFVQKGFAGPLAIACAITGTGLLNVAADVFIYRPMEKRRNSSNTILVASIGLFIILTNLTALLFGNETKTLSSSISGSWQTGDIIITRMQLWQLFIASAVIVIAFIIFNRTKAGLYLRAISNDTELFIVFGKNPNRVRTIIFFVSGMLAAAAALLISYDVGFDPYYGMPLLLNGMVAMIAGGIGSYSGSVTGGVLLGLLQSISVYYFEARWETAITFAILLLVLIARPQGLFGLKQRLV